MPDSLSFIPLVLESAATQRLLVTGRAVSLSPGVRDPSKKRENSLFRPSVDGQEKLCIEKGHKTLGVLSEMRCG